jgi:hypothetical protein
LVCENGVVGGRFEDWVEGGVLGGKDTKDEAEEREY